MAEVRLNGDFDGVSVWNDSWEVIEKPEAPLRANQYLKWQRDLLRAPNVLSMVGGERIAMSLDLMLVEANAWNDNRGAAIGFPVYEDGELVNLIRRFLDGKLPKYQGLRGRGHQLWPDRCTLPPLGVGILLVCGMRDVCTARRHGITAYTTTGGVGTWPDEWLAWLAPGRDIKVIFDVGEEDFALALVRRLRIAGAKSAWMRKLPSKLARGQDITDLDARFGARSWLEDQMAFRGLRVKSR